MNFNPNSDHNPDHEKEIIQMWQTSSPPGPDDATHLARSIAAKIHTFDRRIRRRNLREYLAGAVVTGFFLWKMFDPAMRFLSAAGLVAVAFMMFRLWRGQRGIPHLDPSGDARSYQTALLDRCDRQIRALSRAGLWYVLPAYLWMLLVNITGPGLSSLRRVVGVLVSTAFCAFVVWLNENYAVSKLRAARQKAESMLQRPE